MKNKKKVKEFHFLNKTKEEVKDIINNNYPINIKEFEDIINRIYEKYPTIDKSQISVIVKTVFESMRDFLVLGYVMNFNKFIFDMKLHFITNVVFLIVKLVMPPKLKDKK